MTAAARVPLASLGLRFLRLGAIAWGGPIVQIAALHDEFVVRERLVDGDRFRRALAVYQAMPGPEATEMCIWIGTTLRGRVGGLVAGLGFVLPGLALMLLACSLLFALDPWPSGVEKAFAGMQAAVVALVARAAWRMFAIAAHGDGWLRGIAISAAVGAGVGVPFAASLVGGGVLAAVRKRPLAAATTVLAWLTIGALLHEAPGGNVAAAVAATQPSSIDQFATGLRAGLLTFGGAYTVIPFLQADAVGGGWLTQAQFLSGLAVGAVIPAPMVILGTWVGWAGGGLVGALLLTLGIFLPAFVLPLVLHERLEAVVRRSSTHAFLDGVTAAVVGLVVAVAVGMAATLDSPLAVVIAAGAFTAQVRVRRRFVVPATMLVAASIGLLVG